MATLHDDNREATDRIVEISQRLLDLERRPVPRDQHPKHHGCVRAKFVIKPDLGADLRKGLFQEERVYDAWIRFSNGAQRDDRRPDVHGMAIKLMDVVGQKAVRIADGEPDELTQDFVMVDHPTFFLKDAVEYAEFSQAVLKSRGKVPSHVRTLLSHFFSDRTSGLLTLIFVYFFPWRLRTLTRLMAFASRRIANPLATRYWSTTAYRFDSKYMKFSAAPAELHVERRHRFPASDSYRDLATFLDGSTETSPQLMSDANRGENSKENYLREAMAHSLTDAGAMFLFKVQSSNNTQKTPIDDPRIDWLDSDAPFHTVAYLWIPPQEFQTEKRDAFCENLSMTPWHALAAHAPVGQINEIRRLVYEQLSEDRHRINGVTRREPRATDPDPDAPGAEPLVAWGNDPSAFSTVLGDELSLIRERREKLIGGKAPWIEHGECPASIRGGDEDARTKQFRLVALRNHVTGLAISGGGIRSGTFAVGFLQGLAENGLIRRFDYLSTVSGGGYAGAWLAAWLRREGGDPLNVEKMLAPSRVSQASAVRQMLNPNEVVDEEPEPLRHLRAYSRYLFPRAGLFSVDAWTVVLIWLRNVVINLMMLVPAMLMLVVGARLAVTVYRFFNPLTIETPGQFLLLAISALILGAILALKAFWNNERAIRAIRNTTQPDPSMSSIGTPDEVRSLVQRGIIIPLAGAAFLLTAVVRSAFWVGGDLLVRPQQEPERLDTISVSSIVQDAINAHLGLLDWPALVASALLIGCLIAAGSWRNSRGESALRRRRFARAAFVAGANGGLLFTLLAGLMRALARLPAPDLMATFGMPLALLVVIGSVFVFVGLLGRTIHESEREWWARLSAMGTLTALTWIGVMASVIYVPGVLFASGGWLRTAVASGWLGTAAFGVLTGRYVAPRTNANRTWSLTTLASVASMVFLVGLVGMVSLVVSLLANSPSLLVPSEAERTPFQYYLLGVNGGSAGILFIIGVIAATLYTLASDWIDVNVFSLNAMYANRLTRCYIAATRAMSTWRGRWGLPRDLRADAGAPSISNPSITVRQPNPVTGLDPTRDDIPLEHFKVGDPADNEREYLGPHLLINTTLNLVGASSLVRQDRKGESFLLSPLYCGSKSVGYARLGTSTEEGNVEANLTLGRAIAISGAAVDPNMSFYQSGPLTALLTLFNARLGYWIEKPRPIGWRARSPRLGNLLLTELFGRTDARGEFVHISDGGHFENLGVYELIRRRCRYIIALDAGDDGDPSNNNLANLIRLCRIDFGIRIKIDTRPLTMQGADRLTRTHVVVGDIHYEDVDRGEMPGILVYVKISLTGDEAPDVQRYARTDPRFPHQPTDLRQSFDEEQFECYRDLGDHIAREVFGDPVRDVAEDLNQQGLSAEEVSPKDYNARLFAAVEERWSEPPVAMNSVYLEANSAWSEIQRDLAQSHRLQRLSQDLYPEVTAGGETPSRAELHTISRMLVIMQNSWVALSLERTAGLPMNRGWVNAFRRWVATDVFRRAWPILRSECNSDFVRFCEEQLHLTAARPSAVPLAAPFDQLPESDRDRKSIELLDVEFAREWPAEHRKPRGVIDLVRQAASSDQPTVWLINQAPSGPAQAKDSSDRFACGIIVAVEAALPVSVMTGCAGQARQVQLFVWVRRAYRSSGLGTSAVQETLREIRSAFADANGPPLLWATYPRALAGEYDLEFSNYVRFLSRFDFRPTGGSTLHSGSAFVLVLHPSVVVP